MLDENNQNNEMNEEDRKDKNNNSQNNNKTIINYFDILYERGFISSFLIAFILAFLFAFTPYWQLVILATLIGGWFESKMIKAAASTGLSVILAWGLYILVQYLTSNVAAIVNAIGGIILGSSGSGGIIILLVLIIGGIIGALSGSLSCGIKNIIEK